jgi:pyruvate kinase
VFTGDGKLASLVAAYRPTCPIITFCPTSKVARQLILTRGIYPVVGLQDIEDGAAKLDAAMNEVERMGFVAKGDSVVSIYTDSEDVNFKLAQVV